jgi:hypothetical protein
MEAEGDWSLAIALAVLIASCVTSIAILVSLLVGSGGDEQAREVAECRR